MKNAIKNTLTSLGIEYYAVLDYADCRESAPNIMKRESFIPQSVIIYLLPYYTGETENISRYAASLDYHIAISEVNAALSSAISALCPTANLKGYGDHSPIDERHAALVAGLGVAGKNGLLINEKYGSYVFIGDLVTDIPSTELAALRPQAITTCEGCGACLRACPTGILRGEGEDCLSAITQRKGALSDSEIALMLKYNTAWGCDLCQSSCPHNRHPEKTPVEFFYRDAIYSLNSEALDAMSEEEFSRRAYAWRKRATISRNLQILENK